MPGTLHNQPGLIQELPAGMVVKKSLQQGDKIPCHNHPDMDIFFTVVSGRFEVCLDGSTTYHVTPGSTLHFDGSSTIEAEALEQSEAFVFLFQQPEIS